MNNIIKTYVNEVGIKMDCPKMVKKYFLKELTSLIENYSSEHSDLTIEDICKEFGNPAEYKNNLVDTELYKTMLKKAEKKANLFLIMCIVFGIIAVLAVIMTIIIIRECSGTIEISNLEIIDEVTK